MNKLNVVIITNIPSPYRVDFFNYLHSHEEMLDLRIIYSSKNEENRQWLIETDKLRKSYFLDSVTVKVPKKNDTKYIHITTGLGPLLNRIQPDVVVISEYNPTALLAVRWCRHRRIPYISWTDGTLNSEKGINSIQRHIRKYIVKHASRFIASSSKAKEAQIAYGADPDKIYLSLLTVDVDSYCSAYPREYSNKILFVGRLVYGKGLDLLVDALSGVRNNYILTVVGDGPERDSVHEYCYQQLPRDRVIFKGNLQKEEVIREYGKNSIFVLPTRNDCFGLVVLEAMCQGLCVICSRYADGVYDLIRNNDNGYIIDPYNKKEFTGILDELLSDCSLQKKMGGHAISSINKFHFSSTSEGFVNAVKEATVYHSKTITERKYD